MDDSEQKPGKISKKAIRDELSKIEAHDIVVPRSRVVMLKVDAPFDDIIGTIIKDGHSRFPVFSEKIDNIIGVLYAKDLLNLFTLSQKNKEAGINKILRKPLFIPENKKVDELLNEFINTHIHIAIVVDEYGNMMGIITLEDILEVIVGEISDEYDKEETSNYTKISNNEYLILPKMSIKEFNSLFKTRIKSEDFDTIGGFIIEQFGYVPKEGEILNYRNHLFRIKSVDGSKIREIIVGRA
jgi:magnesium and cobalt transporter